MSNPYDTIPKRRQPPSVPVPDPDPRTIDEEVYGWVDDLLDWEYDFDVAGDDSDEDPCICDLGMGIDVCPVHCQPSEETEVGKTVLLPDCAIVGHKWIQYMGLTESFEYCDICGKSRHELEGE